MLTVSPTTENQKVVVIMSDEKIGVDKIRMKRTGTFSTTIVQTVARADTLLHDWQKCCTDQSGCEFEVKFVDGYILKGCIDFNCKKMWRTPLRRHLEDICTNMEPPRPIHYPKDYPMPRFFDIYEFDT